MRLFYHGKDGGVESHVWGYWLCEFKRLFSIVLLRFEDGSREAYHEHAFFSISWVLKGCLEEHTLESGFDTGAPVGSFRRYLPSGFPIITKRTTFHQVRSIGTTWVLSFRGPWAKQWREYIPTATSPSYRLVTLTHGRREVA